MIDIMDIPDGKSGDWEIDTFEVTKSQADLFNLRVSLKPFGGARYVLPGKYKRLLQFNRTVMSNTRAELNDHAEFLRKAKGNILINGLGLGCVVADLLNKGEVSLITVIEKSGDVISLVKPFFDSKCNGEVNIIHADAYTWQPPKGVRYDAVWHDIWTDISYDNVEGMKKLHRKYGKRCGYQASWCRNICEKLR